MKTRFSPSLAPTLFLAALLPLSHADSWPMYRGNPSLSATSTSPLPKSLKLRWSFPTGGDVDSSPAIVDQKVFIGSTSSNLFCLALHSGKKLWQFKADGPIESSPLVHQNKVYFGDSHTNFYALHATNGALVWRAGADGEFKGGPNWVPSPNGGPPRIIAGNWDNRLYCFDSDSGRTLWTYETGNRINGSPAVAQGFTVFGGCDALIHVVNLADGKKSGEIDAGAYIAASAALLDNRAYVGHYENEFLCVDLKEARVVWRYRDRAFPFMSSPAITANRVLVGSNDKRLHCIDRSSGKPIWTFATRGKIESSPLVAHDTVAVGSSDGRLYLVDLETGKERWSYEIGKPVRSSPATADGYLVVGADDGSVYAFGPP